MIRPLGEVCGNRAFAMGRRGPGSERAPGFAGTVGGEPAWNEMEEGASEQPFPLSLPSSGSGAWVPGARRDFLDRWAREPVSARCHGVGWAGVVPRHARRMFFLAEGSREGRAHVTPACPRVVGVGDPGGEKGFGVGRRTLGGAVKL